MDEAEALPFAVQPEEAIAAFRAKGWSFAFDWRDVWQEENVRAFTVAKALCRDLLEDIRAEVDRSISEGRTLAQFAADLRPKLEARGWWGRKRMIDPATGEERVVQLGSPARLRTIYRANMRTSQMAGRWQRLQRTKRAFPYLRYVAILDGRERPEHGSWHDTILPVDDPWWDTHFPPCGWNCRCDAQPLNQRMIDRRGWQVTEEPARFPVRDYVNKRTGEVVRLERGIDPGWGYNVGKATLDGLTPPPRVRGPSGEDGALNAVLSEADYAPVRGFFAAFGLTTREGALAGTVWTDPAGWPVPISAGLLRGADGAIVRLPADRAAALVVSARVMQAPDTISWIWVLARDGRAMLVRRYRSAAGVVDIGARFWRWHAGDPGRFPAGQAIWRKG